MHHQILLRAHLFLAIILCSESGRPRCPQIAPNAQTLFVDESRTTDILQIVAGFQSILKSPPGVNWELHFKAINGTAIKRVYNSARIVNRFPLILNESEEAYATTTIIKEVDFRDAGTFYWRDSVLMHQREIETVVLKIDWAAADKLSSENVACGQTRRHLIEFLGPAPAMKWWIEKHCWGSFCPIPELFNVTRETVHVCIANTTDSTSRVLDCGFYQTAGADRSQNAQQMNSYPPPAFSTSIAASTFRDDFPSFKQGFLSGSIACGLIGAGIGLSIGIIIRFRKKHQNAKKPLNYV